MEDGRQITVFRDILDGAWYRQNVLSYGTTQLKQHRSLGIQEFSILSPALWITASARAEAFRQGVAGYAQDILIQGRPWPFDPGSIAVPVHVVRGELDTVLPLAHSRHTSELIPGSTLRVLPGHGHFTILGELPTMASALGRTLG
jgi:pimeloyl-ACP methyl ester carboxylesterase